MRTTFVLLVSLAAVTVGAQQQPTFRSRTELIRVDVVVTGSDGKPIEGLKASDFTVYDRRKPQTIQTFDEIRHPRSPAPPAGPQSTVNLHQDVAANTGPATDRFVVMVLDDLHTYKGRTTVVKDIARRIVNELGEQASMAIIFTSAEHNTEVTEDRALLLSAIDTFSGRRGVRRPMTASDERGGALMAIPNAGGPPIPYGNRNAATNLADFDANMSLYGALQSAARALGGNDTRRKAFVLVSEGLAQELSGLFDSLTAPAQSMQGAGTYSADELAASTAAQSARFHDNAVLGLMDAMRRSNVVTYAIDPRGQVKPQDILAECIPTQTTPDPCVGNGSGFSGWVRQAQRGLDLMASASGGFAVVDTNDFTSGVDRMLDDLDHYYMLGFYPAESGGKDYRPLDVRVNRPDALVRFRRGYQLDDPPAPAKPVDPLATLSSGVLPNSDVPLRVFATSLPGEGKTARIPVALEVTVPRQALEDANANLLDDVRYSILVIDLKGQKVKEQHGQAAHMGLQPRVPGLPPPDRVTYQIDLELALPPGRYQLRASAASAKLAKGGSVYLSLQVPDYSSMPLAISGLTIGYAGGARVPVFSGSPVQAGRQGRGRGPAPPPAIARQTAPTLDREFTAADTLWVGFELARRKPLKDVATRLSAINANDVVVRHVDYAMPASHSGRAVLQVPLNGLPPGAYRLSVTAMDDTNMGQQQIGIVVK